MSTIPAKYGAARPCVPMVRAALVSGGSARVDRVDVGAEPRLAPLAAVSVKPFLPAALHITSEEKAAYDAHNALMMKRYGKYPELALVCKDPDAFIQSVKDRFEAQKSITPGDPYQFDFSDYGMPVLQEVHGALQRKLGKLTAEAKAYDAGWHLFGNHAREEYKTGIAFLQDLVKDVGGIVERGSVSYRRMQELAHFTTNAMGYFDKVTAKERLLLTIDDRIEGHVHSSIQDMHKAYKRNSGFPLFEGHALWNSVEQYAGGFEEGLFNPEKMEFVNLPTMRPLGRSLFMRYMPYPLYFKGIGEEPIPAEGFMREGGRFSLHDDRHNSCIFGMRKEYIEKHQLDDAQVFKLQKSMDLWHHEMNEATGKMEDKPLKEAIALSTFSYHHDSGFPYLPSHYVEGIPTKVLYFTYWMKEIAHQSNGFKKPFTNIPRANEWLNGFWQSRYPAERAIIDAAPAKP